MQKIMRVLGALLLAFTMVACGGGASRPSVASQQQGKKVAIVSVSANNYANSLQGWNSAATSDLMGSRLNTMLQFAEAEFGKRWTVVPATEFVGKDEVRKQAGPPREVGLPKLGDQQLLLQADDRDQLIGAELSPAKAKALVSATGADLLVVIYSEWGVKTGGFIPTSKALTKNVVSVYDGAGQQIYHGRKDVVGEKTLGALGNVAVNDETIEQWVESYKQGLTQLFAD